MLTHKNVFNENLNKIIYTKRCFNKFIFKTFLKQFSLWNDFLKKIHTFQKI